MISKDTYKGKNCVIALNSLPALADDDSWFARSRNLTKQAKREGCSYALSVKSLGGDGEDTTGVFLLNDGAGVDLSLQLRRCSWFDELASSEDGGNGFLVVFPLDKKVYLAQFDGEGELLSDMVVPVVKVYKDRIEEYLKENRDAVIYRVATEGAAADAANQVDLGAAGRGYFDVGSTSELDVFSKKYRFSKLSFLMVKQGYYHPIYLTSVVLLFGAFVAYDYYRVKQAEIEGAIKRAAQATKREQASLFNDYVGYGGSKTLNNYAVIYADLVRRGVHRDAMISLKLKGSSIVANGLMTVGGGNGVPAQSAYPDNAYRYIQNNRSVTFSTGVSSDGWKLRFDEGIQTDRRAMGDWGEREIKHRLIGIARNTFSGLTLISESVLSTSPNIYELEFSFAVANGSPERLSRMAEYFHEMPVAIESIDCNFTQNTNAASCLIVGQAAYLL
ncbi:hypothetical protein N9L66_00370 [Porticoccaceae bacterium]|nr:hypothetical protein [Porticoccaceae bacterium]MDA8663400.1 hypothetical protein [Porticoccaceae bacterium]